MRILLTGERGFIGSHVHQALKDRGFEVVTLHQDLRNRILLTDNVDYIIDLASYAEVQGFLEEPRLHVENNILATLNVLECAREIQPRRMIHISSAEVYGPGEHSVESPHRPTNPYAASKAAQDSICRSYRASFDVPVSIAVIQNVYGENQPSHKFYPVIKQKIENGEEIQVLKGERRFTDVTWLASQLVDLLFEPVGDYHIAGEINSNLGFAQSIAESMGKELKYKLVESDRPGHEEKYILKGIYGQ